MRGANEITNNEDTIDSRAVIDRIDYLESERSGVDEAEALETWDASDEGQELKALKALQDEAEGYSDWKDGATLIRDSYFEAYAEELASEISDYNPRKVAWPFTCIDWA
jgi:hypothetical protein